jgi:hypothetical protein
MQSQKQQRVPPESPARAGWRIRAWGESVGVGRSHVNDLIKNRIIRARKSGSATIIETQPADYIASLPDA